MITIDNLTKAYGKQLIFDHVTYQFPDEGLYCLIGASGCGKSTLLNLLAGFDCDYEGNIHIHDTCISSMDKQALCSYRRNTIGFIFQDYHLLKGYSVLDNILIASISGDNQLEYTNKALSFLEKLGLLDKAHEKTENLSGGQKQRVAIIRALMNDPTILLADEPTGALDRTNANDIMQILKEISQHCLVIVITHDKKLCEYAEESLQIKDKQIIGTSLPLSTTSKTMKINHGQIRRMKKLAYKNIKVHWKSFLIVSFAIAFGMLAFLLSLSFGNIIESSIADFKDKNIAFNNGYIQADQDIHKAYSLLQQDDRISNLYYQYIVQDISLKIDDHVETMAEKYPMAKASETMSYGTMPRKGQNEIALSPSLAKKFNANIASLVGKKIQLNHLNKEESLTISGIFNAGYDDFFLSSDIEQTLYQEADTIDAFSLSYDVNSFEDVVFIQQMLSEHQINSITLAEEVNSLLHTFANLTQLFMIISLFILSISIFISMILLVKLRNTRFREIGLLSALGFQKREITSMLYAENILLALLAAGFTSSFMILVFLLSLQFDIKISLVQYIASIFGSVLVIFVIGVIINHKLSTIEPAKALRK